MKKIYTLLAALLCAGAASAQTFSVTNFDAPVSEGDVITYYAEVEDYGFYIIEAKSNPTSSTGLLINNLTGASLPMTVTATELSHTVGGAYDIGLCCGGTCVRGTGSVEKEFSARADKATPFQYDVNFNTIDNYGEVMTRVEVKSGSETLSFFVKFVYGEETGITSAKASDGLSFGERTLNYRFAAAAPRTLRIFAPSGKLLRAARLTQQGSISLVGLPAGLYIFEVVCNGRKEVARKVVIR